MIHQPKPTDPARRPLWNCLVVCCLAVGLTCFGGCNRPASPPSDKPGASDEEPPTTGQPTPESPIVEKGSATAERVLEGMVAAYKKASSYADAGSVRLLAEVAGERIDRPGTFALTLVRPDKIRIEMYEAMVVSDGQQLRAALENLPNQVLAKKAPAELDIKSIGSDRILASVLTGGFAGVSPQLILLLEDDPLKLLLKDAGQTVLGKPGTIDGRDYYRVEITGPDGTTVFWIDQESYVLRRIVFPTDELRRMLARGGTVESLSVVADFEGAQLGGEIDPTAFQFEIPADAKVVKFFVPPPPPDPGELLGKGVPEFKFFDLEGKPVTPGSLAGKIAVLDFWATWCGPCRTSLPNFEKVYQQYKDNERIIFFSVSVDQPDVENKTLQRTFVDLGVHVPILRDLEGDSVRVFKSANIPAMFIIDGNGVVQDFEVGANPRLATILPEKLEKLLAGEDIYHEPLKAYQERWKEYERWLKTLADSESPEGAVAEEDQIPQAKVAQPSRPSTFRLTRLWKCTELTAPGNILPVGSAGGPARLLVVDGWKSVAEVGLDGKLIATHPLDIDQREFATVLRTAAGADGKRYFVAFAMFMAQQRFHLLDEDWKLLVSYPEDALENKHGGIADVQLGDLDGDGTLEAYVGYWGVVGVQAVSLKGKRLWSNRSVSNVARIAIGNPDAPAGRHLLCTNYNGSLVLIDSKAQRLGEVTVAGQPLRWIVAADLSGDGRPEWCALAGSKLGEDVAIGLNLQGKELWNYPLPKGVHQQPVEPVVAGNLLPGAPGQWLLPGADGSIHVIAADGKPLDRFNYGATLGGLATVELAGRPLLIVSSTDGLEAWKVE